MNRIDLFESVEDVKIVSSHTHSSLSNTSETQPFSPLSSHTRPLSSSSSSSMEAESSSPTMSTSASSLAAPLSAPSSFIVHTTSGVVEADYVVVTVPIGVLQLGEGEEGAIQFHPPLPKWKQDAIHSIGMGNENKIFLHFPSVFWPPEEPYIQCTDSRFRFLNLDYFGKKRSLVAHCTPPFSDTWSHLKDDEVLFEVCESHFLFEI